jgi:hypothetical protein
MLAENDVLAEDLLAGRKTLGTPKVLAQLKGLALMKLAVDIPKYPALDHARRKWTGEQ